MEKYIGKGYTGLQNLGNTCFINSCIQVLSHTYELTELLNKEDLEKHIKPNIPETHLTLEFRELIKVMWSNNGVLNPARFLHILQQVAAAKKKEIFTGFAQNDTTELLQFLIDCFHTSISRPKQFPEKSPRGGGGGGSAPAEETICKSVEKFRSEQYEKEYSEIMDLFYGINISKILETETSPPKVITPEFFFILDIPITEGEPTLYDCFLKYTEYEKLENDNKWYNDKTKEYEEVYKKYDICSTPQILVILLNRFSNNPFQKNQALVKFPHILDMPDIIDSKYELYGICNHVGNPFFGHYTSFVKNAANEWLFYNDESIQKVENADQVITPIAYCLFYRRK